MLVMVPAGSRGQELGSLKRVSVPQPSEVAKYVSNTSMLVALGKSFFWDMQVGSDSRMACATCHFHAGADHRARNQLVNSLDAFPVNYQLSAEDFPFHLLSNPANNRSAVVRDSAAVVGSAGLFRRAFQDVTPGSGGEDGFDTGDTPAFSISGIHTRRVTPRNAPTVINAVFNVRNFWDGRARSVFTGRTPFGEADPGLHSLLLRDGRLTLERVRVDNASLASQAVAPPVNNVEMTYDGRTWLKIGKKMLSLRPLALQRVAADDSVLGELANGTGRGLHPSLTYLGMVQAVFKPEYWNSTQLVDREGRELGRVAPAQSTSEFTQAEFNFALFWGLAIQAYESTFVSDDSRFDRFSEGSADALTDQERRGLQLFRGQGGCTNCHVGPELTTASFTSIARRGLTQGGQNIPARDTGFLRIGVRPIAEDLGLGADDDFGQPLSVAAALRAAARNSVRGTFKTPTLRNVELTGPYFHNGGQATLDQVVAFYNRGGDFPGDGNLGPGIRQRNLNAGERQALVAFLRSLTDDRVRFERAPFDHPELCVPVGHEELAPQTLRVDGRDGRFPLSAADRWVGLPAVGRSGNLVPLQTFEELLAGIGGDGSRAHAQSAACTIP
jgi:cytochrome c peroxidase